jgi:hypothetical protein
VTCSHRVGIPHLYCGAVGKARVRWGPRGDAMEHPSVSGPRGGEARFSFASHVIFFWFFFVVAFCPGHPPPTNTCVTHAPRARAAHFLYYIITNEKATYTA